MDLTYGNDYRELYYKHWWWRAREAAILDVLYRRCPQGGWGNILDIGCGDGLFFDKLLEFGHVEGIETSANIVTSDGPHRHRIYVRPFDKDFQPGKQYSLILMLDVLEHVSNPVDVLRHALNLLTSSGRILITVPAFNALWTNQDVVNQHFTRYTKETLRNVAEKAGMLIEDERYWFQWAAPAKLVQRAVERLFHCRAVSPRVPPRPLNTALYLLSRWELSLANRVSFVFGSSLQVFGHKRG
jgi:2-polyprenyl-3-methyl-5-hydroxy-6-metoxy-1,4-benzoquinol methylase